MRERKSKGKKQAQVDEAAAAPASPVAPVLFALLVGATYVAWLTRGGGGLLPAVVPAVAVPTQPEKRAAAGPPTPLVGVVEEHDHVMPWYARAKAAGLLDAPATILHIDSHADMGVPLAWPEGAPVTEDIEDYAEINDFLVLAAFAGLADHLIFVEPPWSNQWRCCVYEEAGDFDFIVGVDGNGDVRVAADGGAAAAHGIDRFSHIFYRDGPRTADAARLTRTRRFRVSVVAAEADLEAHLTKLVRPDRPLILDVDLDYFATENHGAIPLRERWGATDADLMVLYHLSWDFPELGVEYFLAADPLKRDADGADAYETVAKIDKPLTVPDFGNFMTRAARRRNVDPDRRAVMDAFASSRDVRRPPSPRPDDFLVFLEQPFHVPEALTLEDELRFHFGALEAALRALPRPFLANVIRSPGYVPERHLDRLECGTLDLLAAVYGPVTVSHEARVDARRTGCTGVAFAQVASSRNI